MAIDVDEIIEAPISTVWSFVGDFGGLRRWHATILSCTLSGEGVGAIRTIVRTDGTVRESLDHYDPINHELAYSIVECDRPEMLGMIGAMKLDAIDPTRTRLRWSARLFDDISDQPAIETQVVNYFRMRSQHLREAIGHSGQQRDDINS